MSTSEMFLRFSNWPHPDCAKPDLWSYATAGDEVKLVIICDLKGHLLIMQKQQQKRKLTRR